MLCPAGKEDGGEKRPREADTICPRQRKPVRRYGKKARKDTVSGVLPGLSKLFVLGISPMPVS